MINDSRLRDALTIPHLIFSYLDFDLSNTETYSVLLATLCQNRTTMIVIDRAMIDSKSVCFKDKGVIQNHRLWLHTLQSRCENSHFSHRFSHCRMTNDSRDRGQSGAFVPAR